MVNLSPCAPEPSTAVCISELCHASLYTTDSSRAKRCAWHRAAPSTVRQTQASLNSFESIKCAHAKTVVHVLDYHGLHFRSMDATMPPLYFSYLLYLKFKKVQCQKTSKFFVQLHTVLPIWTHPPTPAQLLFYSKNIL